jgi:transcriptional regulator with XRE-family HTH domain
VGVPINAEYLRRELARRGWNSNDLARAAKLSHATVSAACTGRMVSPTTLRLIASALSRAAVVTGVDALLQ